MAPSTHKALILAQDKLIKICTDSEYEQHMLHYRASVWQEGSFPITKGTSITNGLLILQLLEASYLPKQAAVIHC